MPKKTQTIEATRTEAGWTMTARWEIQEGRVTSSGPTEILIEPTEDASATVKGKGITTGVLRRLEALLSDMAAEAVGRAQFVRPSDIARSYAAEQVAAMPASPRKDPAAYYGTLLRAFDGLARMGAAEPINVLADVLDLPKNTVRTQLATARRRSQPAG
ncbi:hypothetical protein [Micromonospora fulviviridis]|uniref:hypothetical protein n=1 Tax=Micromonospora fulviviridis TaxID=47860 RepID=UPI0037B77466